MKPANVKSIANHLDFCNIPSPHRNKKSSKKKLRCDIVDKNYEILLFKMQEKFFLWRMRLYSQGTELLYLCDCMESDPNNKELNVQFKKLKRSYFDSLKAFEEYCQYTTQNILYLLPESPLHPYDDSGRTNHTFQDIQAKFYRHYDKKRKNAIRKARKQKYQERDFFMEEWKMTYSTEGSEKMYQSDYEAYLNAQEDLIKAEQALNSSIVHEAAWAIHNGTEGVNKDIIEEANTIFKNYIDAVKKYEKCTGKSF